MKKQTESTEPTTDPGVTEQSDTLFGWYSVLHEFTSLCAEQALARVANPDPRSVEAIACKRRWLAAAATDAELATACAAAYAAARAAQNTELESRLTSLLKLKLEDES